MTSLAIAETLVTASKELERREAARAEERRKRERPLWQRLSPSGLREFGVRLTAADVACLLLLPAVAVFARRGWYRRKQFRTAWLILVVGVIGLWSGNLISMALVAGWSSEGVAWRLAPALALLVVVAFVSPAVAKSNPYCNHLCPHGALQQLIRPGRSARRHLRVPRRLAKWLSRLPGMLLVFAYVTLGFDRSADLSSWEPFHAYLFRIAPWTAIAFAVFTLIFAAFVPMGYCRYGCPTGSLLDHLRRSSASGKLRPADGIALALLAIAVATHLWF